MRSAAICTFIRSLSISSSAPVCPDAKLRKLVRNMIYDGVVANLLSIDMDEDPQGAGQAVRKEARPRPPN